MWDMRGVHGEDPMSSRPLFPAPPKCVRRILERNMLANRCEIVLEFQHMRGARIPRYSPFLDPNPLYRQPAPPYPAPFLPLGLPAAPPPRRSTPK